MSATNDTMKQISEYDQGRIEKILIIGAIGIGNLLLFSGTLRRIRRHFASAHITIIVLKEGFKALYENDPSVDEVLVLDVDKVKTFRQKIVFIWKMRKSRYQLCITTFPANRIEYNLLAFFSGAKRRVAHKYAAKKLRSLSFLQNVRIPVEPELHDLEQNLNLLKAFGITPDDEDHRLFLNIPEQAHDNARQYMKENDLYDKQLIGMHPGSSVERGMILKRWPSVYFAELCDWLTETIDACILLFGGKEEERLREEIAVKTRHKSLIVTGLDLLSTASLIGKCALFVSNDSGLMHIAAAMGVQTIAIFGPTDPGRTAPYGQEHRVIRTGTECSPCWSINNLGVGTVRCIHPENICLTELPVEMVKEVISSKLSTVIQKSKINISQSRKERKE
ncbi:hypothetical protein AMJ80_07695 [bacterium SM23_31]|nr:MAG: hypothetical protein AMJ80_07695 [bacterium SM23_31]